jgi:hypothetical protein
MYRWPIEGPEGKLQAALDIALDYLEFTGQANSYSEVERICANIILAAWKTGTRHRIRLANYAIGAIERKQPPPLMSIYPRAG